MKFSIYELVRRHVSSAGIPRFCGEREDLDRPFLLFLLSYFYAIIIISLVQFSPSQPMAID